LRRAPGSKNISPMEPARAARIREQIAWEQQREGAPAGFPALTPIPGGRYTSEVFFALERERLWRRSWLLAAREEDLAEPGAYRVFDKSGAPLLLVRGEDEVIRAFYNTCQHRGAPVVREVCGIAKRLRCQYHSWTYDLAGRLVGVPDRRDFTRLDLAERGLRPVRCESWAGFVFVSEDAAAPPLVEWLGPVARDFAPLACASLRQVAARRERIPCNWKVASDAFMEVYHLNTIHPRTVSQTLDHRGGVMALFPNGHTRMVTPKWPAAIAARGAARTDVPVIPGADPLIRDSNVAYGVFPNLITPLDTIGFPIITFWPLDVRTTEIEWVWYAPAGQREDDPFWSALLPGFDQVMGEDFMNLAPMQRSLESPGLRSIPLSYQERRIYHVHEQIDRTIGVEHVPPELRVEPLLAPFVEE
jgi:phenylpropionate dioxygenase-like ring-hydroxylating dioxygenase large terminal subunit